MAEREKTATVDIKLRLKEPLRARVEAAAAERGVSMNAEMVDRLDRSFDQPEMKIGLLAEVMTLAYGPKLGRIVEALAKAMATVGRHADFVVTSRHQSGERREAWLDTPYTFDQARKAAELVLEAVKPEGEIVPPAPITAEERQSKFFGLSGRSRLDIDPLQDLTKALAGAPVSSLQRQPSEFQAVANLIREQKELGPAPIRGSAPNAAARLQALDESVRQELAAAAKRDTAPKRASRRRSKKGATP